MQSDMPTIQNGGTAAHIASEVIPLQHRSLDELYRVHKRLNGAIDRTTDPEVESGLTDLLRTVDQEINSRQIAIAGGIGSGAE